MTDIKTLRAQAAEARAAAAEVEPMRVPRGRPERQAVRVDSILSAKRVDADEVPSKLERAKKVEKDGVQWYLVEGYASVFERGYEMWDVFGPYTEVVSKGAADETLSADPMVVYRFNHGGMSMATTMNGRLELWTDDTGLGDRAWLNPTRADVQLLVKAIEDRDVTEQSFMFEIREGVWSPDYTEFRINSVNLDRGDVGPVTYGANPYTSVAARAAEFFADIPKLPPLIAREALDRLKSRADINPPAPPKRAEGRSVSLLRAQLLAETGRDD